MQAPRTRGTRTFPPPKTLCGLYGSLWAQQFCRGRGAGATAIIPLLAADMAAAWGSRMERNRRFSPGPVSPPARKGGVAVAAVGLGAVLALGAARAQPAVAPPLPPEAAQRVPLAYQPFTGLRELLELTWGGTEVALVPAPAPVGPHRGRARRPEPPSPFRGVAPPVAGVVHFFHLRAAPWPGGLLGAVASPALPGGLHRLWVDLDADRRFSPAEELPLLGEAFREAGAAAYGPVPLAHQPAASAALVLHGAHLHLVPAGCHAGEALLGGRRVAVGVVDPNLNGVFGERARPGQPAVPGRQGDLLLADWSGDGEWKGFPEQWSPRLWELEAVPFRGRMQLPGGGLYRARVEAQGAALLLEPDPAPRGELAPPAAEWAMELGQGDDSLWLRGNGEDPVALPAGSYELLWCVLGSRDDAGRLWTASIALLSEEEETPPAAIVKVAEGRRAEWAGGPPFRAVLETEGGARGARTFTAELRDRAGNPVAEVRAPGGSRPAPRLMVSTPAGRPVAAVAPRPAGEETSASSSGAEFRWAPPRGLAGALRAELDWELGPFAAERAAASFVVAAPRAARRPPRRRR